MLRTSILFLVSWDSRIFSSGALCDSPDCEITIHKIFIGREGDNSTQYYSSFLKLNDSSTKYKENMASVCKINFRFWNYAQAQALIAKHDAQVARLLDRINRISFAALVADIARIYILYEHGGWYQDAAYEFSDPRLFCNVVKLYEKFGNIFRKYGNSTFAYELKHQNKTERICGVVPAPHCIGYVEGMCKSKNFISRCSLDSSCVGYAILPGVRSYPAAMCDFLICKDTIPAKPNNCITYYIDTAMEEPDDRNVCLNNNFAIKSRYSPVMLSVIKLIRERFIHGLNLYDKHGLFHQSSSQNDRGVATYLHYIGSRGFSDALVTIAGHSRPFFHRGSEIFYNKTLNETLVFANWHGTHRVQSIYGSYNDFNNISSPHAHWTKAINQPLFLDGPPAAAQWSTQLNGVSTVGNKMEKKDNNEKKKRRKGRIHKHLDATS